jgi:hypothetical protein
MWCSQVKEDFFLCEQRCLVGQALASYVRGQRKFNREQENPEVRGGVNIADQSGYSSTHYKFPASFFVTHEISSPSSSSYRQSCSSRKFTFRVFSSITKATPRFALIH